MNKYQNGKIYKITDVDYNKCYIGSTTESLSQRMARHRREYKKYTNNDENKKYYARSMLLFKEYGIENCKIELIENCPSNNRDELLKREGYYIQNTDCLNRCVAGRTKKEYYDDTREHHLENKKQHRLNNIEKYKEKGKRYHEENRELRNEYNRIYYRENREELRNKMRFYNEQNHNKIKQQQNK